MLVKRKELVEFFRRAYPLLRVRDTAKFHYALNKNLEKIRDIQQSLDENCRSDKYESYMMELKKYMYSVCKKDENGYPKMIVDPVTQMPMEYDVEEDKQEEATKYMDELKEKNKDAIEEMKHKVNEHTIALEEEVEFEYYKVKIENILNITTEELLGLEKMVEY